MLTKNKILIVDDETNIRDLLAKFFSMEGYYPLKAQNAIEALNILKTEKPEIVFLDIKMPGLNGVEVLKITKEYNKHAHVVMISGHADESTARETLQLGAFEYICKPIDLERIKEILVEIEISKFAND
jgi:two-component system response regulator (stage 0 sporulation protein F)